MASAACVISTTRREAMPLTLLECLSVGTPVVVYDVRYGPREIVRDGVDGFLVPARDFRAAGAAVVRLLTEPDLRARMSESARTVSTRFSRRGARPRLAGARPRGVREPGLSCALDAPAQRRHGGRRMPGRSRMPSAERSGKWSLQSS